MNKIRRLVPPNHWRHCPGQENPAEISSRGISPTESSKSLLWRHGPNWLVHPQGDVTHTLLNPDEIVNLGCVIDCKNCSKLSTLLRVTVYVIKFVWVLKSKIKEVETSVSTEMSAADVTEVGDRGTRPSEKDKDTDMWKKQFGFFSDGDKIL